MPNSVKDGRNFPTPNSKSLNNADRSFSGTFLIRFLLFGDLTFKIVEVWQHIDLRQWLDGFGDTEKSVRATMRRVKNHPLVPDNIIVRGFIIDSTTWALTEIGE